MSATHYLRLEGVNLSAFVFDTRDLSTNRGGSLMLLNAVGVAEAALKPYTVTTLSQGASMGFFSIETDRPGEAAEAVRAALATDHHFRHATFVIDVIAAGDFPSNREQLLAANRWRQMQAASLVVPPASVRSKMLAKPACALDGLRAADPSKPAPNRENDSDLLLSEATQSRREYGRNQKQEFYTTASGLNSPGPLPAFAHDFESIAVGSKPLDGKIAVFYADGNGFGSIQTEHCQKPDTQKGWDVLIRETRKEFLRSFLVNEVQCFPDKPTLPQDSPWRGIQRNNRDKGKECIRFETLLWGGDEFMFVMPAALGWRFAAFFFEKMYGHAFGEQKLTHAAALVFCSHHAPIHRIKHLAKDQMAEFAKGIKSNKDDPNDKLGRRRDSLVVTALESFDHLGTGFEDAMNQRYRNMLPLGKLILVHPLNGNLGTHLKEIAKEMNALRGSETFPRSQLRGLVNTMLASQDANAAAELAAFTKDRETGEDDTPPRHFRNATGEEKKLLHDILLKLFGGDPVTLWLQLEELWDYALPAPQSAQP